MWLKVNSLVQSIQGRNDEARKIQEEFAGELYQVVQGMPVIGHGIALGHLIAGMFVRHLVHYSSSFSPFI